MEALPITQRILDMNRSAVEGMWNATMAIQDQIERISRVALNQRREIADIGIRATEQWMSQYREGQNMIKRLLDENYENLNKIFSKVEHETQEVLKQAEQESPRRAELKAVKRAAEKTAEKEEATAAEQQTAEPVAEEPAKKAEKKK